MASSTIFRPPRVLAEPQLEGVAHAHLEQLGGVPRGELLFVWPWNCVRTMRAESVKQALPQSSGISFTPLGARPRVSMNAARASKIPERKPASCVPRSASEG